jgi:hypothetical protein
MTHDMREADTILRPCPFCGAPGYAMLAAYGFKIKCTNTDCTVETPIKTHRHQVDSLWNRRADAQKAPQPRTAEPAKCSLGCTTECKAKLHGCASECPALPWQPEAEPAPAPADDVHSCSLYCDRPACIKAQRDQMRDAAPADEFERGRQQGMKQERALWELSRSTQEIEAAPAAPADEPPPLDTIAQAKRILVLVDRCIENHTAGNRSDLRAALLDELGAAKLQAERSKPI